MLEILKQEVYKANLLLVKYNLVLFTWGNVSGIDREKKLIVIKPSGVDYEKMTPEDMVVVDFDGNTVEGSLKPSSDTPTHIELYKAFGNIGGITHTHSHWATVWAQSGRGINPLGTTHADYFDGQIPCTRQMTAIEISKDYEKNTGKVIVERFRDIDYTNMPAVLVSSHGPFTWGKDATDSAENAVVLENVASLAYNTINLDAENVSMKMQEDLLRKHFDRKHGKNAYYGQK